MFIFRLNFFTFFFILTSTCFTSMIRGTTCGHATTPIIRLSPCITLLDLGLHDIVTVLLLSD